jgi:hypothetical protein
VALAVAGKMAGAKVTDSSSVRVSMVVTFMMAVVILITILVSLMVTMVTIACILIFWTAHPQ